MNAMEMMIKSVVENAVKNLPPETLQQIGQISQTVLAFKAQLDRIENQNRLIIAHLNIPPDVEILENQNAERRSF